jgi:hypothetical protein
MGKWLKEQVGHTLPKSAIGWLTRTLAVISDYPANQLHKLLPGKSKTKFYETADAHARRLTLWLFHV